MKRALLLGVVLSVPIASFAQNRCVVNGRSVIQSAPCEVQNQPAGKFRCYVDGAVVYSDVSCLTIKSKAVLAQEAQDKEAAEAAKRKVEAKRLEDIDRPNFPARISVAKRIVALHLRDPESARFQNEFVSWAAGFDVVCGLVSARNGFGGYAQPSRFFVLGDTVEIEGGQLVASFDNYWKKYCRPQ